MMWGKKKTGSKSRCYHLWKVIEPKAYAAQPIRCVSECGCVMADIADIEFSDKPPADSNCIRCLNGKS